MMAAWGLHLDFAPDVAGGALFPYLECMVNQNFGMVIGKGGADTIVSATRITRNVEADSSSVGIGCPLIAHSVPVTAHAQPGKFLVGKRVVQTSGDLTLRIGNGTVVVSEDVPIFGVERLVGPWVEIRAESGIVAGLAKPDDVIPIDQAIRLDPHADTAAYVNRGKAHFARKEYTAAIADMSETNP